MPDWAPSQAPVRHGACLSEGPRTIMRSFGPFHFARSTRLRAVQLIISAWQNSKAMDCCLFDVFPVGIEGCYEPYPLDIADLAHKEVFYYCAAVAVKCRAIILGEQRHAYCNICLHSRLCFGANTEGSALDNV